MRQVRLLIYHHNFIAFFASLRLALRYFRFIKSETAISALGLDPSSPILNKFQNTPGPRPVPCGDAYLRRALSGGMVNRALAFTEPGPE